MNGARRRGSVALSERWKARLAIAQTVAPAALLAFTLEVALERSDLGESLRLFAAYVVLFILFFVLGRWLGKYVWTDRGKALTRRLLRRRLRRKELVFLSDRPDRSFTTLRRVWEVVGFAAGLSVIFSALLGLLGLELSEAVAPLVGIRFASVVTPLLVPLLVTFASFVLIPYWLFARLGFRIVDPVRWLISPLSRTYADRLKLSNGFLILAGAGLTFNLAYRAGDTNTEAVVTALILVLRNVAVVLVIAATAVAYYLREERAVARLLEHEALEMGIRDGRGMSDGDFLPRLPKAGRHGKD